MNRFGTLIAWAQGFLNHTALPAIAQFIATLVHDELAVAEALVEKVVDSIPADLAAAKPLVALATVIQAAAAQALQDGITVGKNALAVAAANLVDRVAGSVPVTQVDAGDAVAKAMAERDAAIAAAQKKFDEEQKALTTAAEVEAAALRARVSS